jgi:hypothetical protein
LSAEDKPSPTAPPPSGAASDGNGGDRDKSSPNLSEVDSAWNDEEEYDEDATMVAKVPLDLVALSRRGTELEKKPEPEKHDAITARPPPQPGEASVVIDAPHENLPKIETPSVEIRADGGDDDEDEDEEHDDDDDLVADDLDAGWDIEEERAVAADVAAGLDAEARRKAAEARAAQRKEKSRAKKIAAKEKRKARADSIRSKQKKPRKRSIPPPRESIRPAAGKARTPVPPKPAASARATSPSREFPTIPPKDSRAAAPLVSPSARRDMNRMIFIVAIIVVIGALVIGLSRR